ncbi:kelch domain-containing protein 3-like isoform X3 [Durio zibethinus]|uniref:Kelch domain-containing protein 3-like isoform X3 n=1 Tax=Durio zibethinus TaxID=66656 RepID=A0A6P5YAP0_DURZI|nr:kelch domain-containing protein 3-like isoform X3 [Durio zibethinus]
MRWEKVQFYQQEVGGVGEACPGPGRRWGHTCNSIKGGRFLYVFGGYGKDNCQTNQVHVFDTAKQTWSQPAMKGTPPTPRDSHSCTTVGDNLFVFGGTDGMNPLKDLHILDTETFVWKHAATSGNPPSARDSHTCSSWKNKIIVIGGEDGHDYYLSDVHILDADTLAWKELNTSGQMLPPRAGHSTVAFGKNLFVFGGFTDAQNLYDDLYMLDVDTGMWTRVITMGDGPSARFSVAGDCLDPLKSGVLVFIGGCNKTLEALDDMYYIYTGLVVRDERKLEKLSLRKQLKLKCQEQNLSNIVHDKALATIEVSNDVHQPIPLSSYGHPGRENFPLNQVLLQGKKTFQAKVTESFTHGYTIETVIDGKPLRGILFASKPSSGHVLNHNLSRKRTSVEARGTVLNDDCNSKSRSMRLDCGDHKQADIHEMDYSLCDTEAPAPSLRNPAHSDLSTHKDPAKQDFSPLVAHLNLNDDKAGDAPNSGTEVLKGVGAMRAGYSVTLSSKQGERRPNTLEHNNPEKLL